jgi:hypothetical protein
MISAYEFASVDNEAAVVLLNGSKVFVGGQKWKHCYINDQRVFSRPYREAVHGRDRNEVLDFDFISIHMLTPKSKTLIVCSFFPNSALRQSSPCSIRLAEAISPRH